MDEIILEAIERGSGKFRETGFIPGVLYGDGIEAATVVKFDEKTLNKIIGKHGNSAKLWIIINNTKKYGFIKEVQRKNITRTLSHVDVQIVSKDHEIRMQIPITFIGDDLLKARQLQLQVYKSEINVHGKMALVPDSIDVDVSQMKLGDTITLGNFSLDKLLKIENEDTVYGTIIYLKAQAAEAEEPKTE